MGRVAVFEDKELQELITHFTLPLKDKPSPKTNRKKVIVISGPTAVGKTSLSLLIASVLGGEIVSADSMQVYKKMDIGTAKVSKEDRQKIPHHLIDIRELHEGFNVMDFYMQAMQAIEEITARNHVPIIVGGTGFYLHSLLYGPPSGPPSVPQLRVDLENEVKEKGVHVLYDRLKALDPDYAAMITRSDRHKIVRALEIITLTNKKVSDFSSDSRMQQELYDFRCWFIYMPKEVLYPRVEMRCDKMLSDGLVEEVKDLEKIGLRENISACQAIGYRQCLDFLRTPQTPKDWENFLDAFKKASRRYAKRQFTWFRKETLFRWLNIDHLSLETVAELIIQDFEQNH